MSCLVLFCLSKGKKNKQLKMFKNGDTIFFFYSLYIFFQQKLNKYHERCFSIKLKEIRVKKYLSEWGA